MANSSELTQRIFIDIEGTRLSAADLSLDSETSMARRSMGRFIIQMEPLLVVLSLLKIERQSCHVLGHHSAVHTHVEVVIVDERVLGEQVDRW